MFNVSMSLGLKYYQQFLKVILITSVFFKNVDPHLTLNMNARCTFDKF